MNIGAYTLHTCHRADNSSKMIYFINIERHGWRAKGKQSQPQAVIASTNKRYVVGSKTFEKFFFRRKQERSLCCIQGWKPGYLALGCQFQFRCVETQMSGLSFGLVSRLLKNRFQFRFQFCVRAASVSGFQFRFKFHPRKLFYC